MLELAGAQSPEDDRIAESLLAGVPEAHRLAAWILRDSVCAEDAVQEALLRAWKVRQTIRFELGQPQRWFMRIVVNVCRDELRRRRRSVVAADPASGMASVAADAPEGDHGALDRAIGRLKPDEQVVLGLRFGRDLTIPQIAAQTGLREGTVKSRLHYALEHVRAALEAERRAQEQKR